MCTDSNIINKPLNFRMLILLALFLFFIGGVTVGYIWGGHTVHTNWQEYYEEECEPLLEQQQDNFKLEDIKWE